MSSPYDLFSRDSFRIHFLLNDWMWIRLGSKVLEFSVQLHNHIFYAQRGRYFTCPEQLLCRPECFPGAKQNNTGLFTSRSEKNKQQHGNNKLHQQETWIKKLFANMLGKKSMLSYGCIGTGGFIVPAKGFKNGLKKKKMPHKIMIPHVVCI